MKYSFRQPPGNYKYTLKIFYGGELKEGEIFYQYYVGGEVTWVDELDPNKANLTELNNIASELGYHTTEISYLYRSPTSGNLVKITLDQHVTNMIKELPISRELELYIDGVREEEEPEEYPIVLFWNCRGLNSSVKLMLRVLVSVYDPTIIFLIETRLSSEVIKEISSSLGFRNIRDSPTSRNLDDLDNCVGLAMLWKTKAKLDFFDKTSNYLDFVVNVGPNNEKWRLTGFYGHPKFKKRSWEWLQNLSKNIDLPWLCFGDFNEILDHEDKSGGRKKANLKILAFKNVIKGCDLHDLPFKGRRFTWANNDIKERLDRGLVSSTWKNIFPSPGVFHCTDKTISDHLPIVIKTDGRKQKLRNIETLYEEMKDVLSFVNQLEDVYHDPKRELMTVSNIRNRIKRKWKDYYFDVAQNVAPQFINLKYIAVHYKNTKEVKYERLVTLTTCYNLSLISLNCMVSPEPSREDDLEIPPECPSASCIKTMKNELNLSEYLAKTWNLILLIPTDAKITRQQFVDQNTNEQVENLVMCLEDLFPQADDGHFVIGTGKEFSNLIEKSDENALVVGRAFIVCNIIINLIRDEWMAPEGTITKLEEQLFKDLKSYFPNPEDEKDENFKKLYVIEPLQFLLDNFKWRVREDLSRYNINAGIEQLTEVENTRFTAERKAMMSKKLNPLIQLIINDGGSIEREKLEKLIKDQIDKRTIEDQIDLLISMGCISQSKEDEIVLSETDKSRESIVERLKEAAAEAMKKLRDSSKKTMTYLAYMRKLEKAYKTRTALLKSKTKRDVSSKRGVTKRRNNL